MTIKHSESGSKGRFYIDEDGRQLGEMTYSKAGDTMIIIDHTEVSEELKGQGAGKKLVFFGAHWARENGKKVLPLCPFAKAIFQRFDEIQDVLK